MKSYLELVHNGELGNTNKRLARRLPKGTGRIDRTEALELASYAETLLGTNERRLPTQLFKMKRIDGTGTQMRWRATLET